MLCWKIILLTHWSISVSDKSAEHEAEKQNWCALSGTKNPARKKPIDGNLGNVLPDHTQTHRPRGIRRKWNVKKLKSCYETLTKNSAKRRTSGVKQQRNHTGLVVHFYIVHLDRTPQFCLCSAVLPVAVKAWDFCYTCVAVLVLEVLGCDVC